MICSGSFWGERECDTRRSISERDILRPGEPDDVRGQDSLHASAEGQRVLGDKGGGVGAGEADTGEEGD